MTFTDELRARIKATQREWEKCREDVGRAKEKESRVRGKLAALQVLLNSEQPKGSKSHDTAAPAPMPTGDTPETSKAETVRLLIQQNGSDGLTPAQIRKLLVGKSWGASGNYLYAVLLRAKTAGFVLEKNGRYYPAEKEKTAS